MLQRSRISCIVGGIELSLAVAALPVISWLRDVDPVDILENDIVFKVMGVKLIARC